MGRSGGGWGRCKGRERHLQRPRGGDEGRGAQQKGDCGLVCMCVCVWTRVGEEDSRGPDHTGLEMRKFQGRVASEGFSVGKARIYVSEVLL